MKTCKICKFTKPLTEFNPASKYKDKVYYRGECKECNLKQQSSNQAAQIKYRNSEKGRKAKSDYKKTEKYKEYQREYDKTRVGDPKRKESQYAYLKRRLKEDPFFRLRLNVRNRLRNMMKVKNWHKDNTFKNYIGCELDALKMHIEKQFTEGMTWDNYGHGEKCWTLDHIYPLSLAKTEEEMYKLCHYTNLQPLWRLDNIKKSNKI